MIYIGKTDYIVSKYLKNLNKLLLVEVRYRSFVKKKFSRPLSRWELFCIEPLLCVLLWNIKIFGCEISMSRSLSRVKRKQLTETTKTTMTTTSIRYIAWILKVSSPNRVTRALSFNNIFTKFARYRLWCWWKNSEDSARALGDHIFSRGSLSTMLIIRLTSSRRIIIMLTLNNFYVF